MNSKQESHDLQPVLSGVIHFRNDNDSIISLTSHQMYMRLLLRKRGTQSVVGLRAYLQPTYDWLLLHNTAVSIASRRARFLLSFPVDCRFAYSRGKYPTYSTTRYCLFKPRIFLLTLTVLRTTGDSNLILSVLSPNSTASVGKYSDMKKDNVSISFLFRSFFFSAFVYLGWYASVGLVHG